MAEENNNKVYKFLNENESFKIVNIEYTEQEKNCLDNFNITNFKTFDYYGIYSSIDGINEYLSNVGNNSAECIQTMNNVINMIAEYVYKGCNKDHLWLTIRITQPNSDFDIPRWHQDGNFFTNNDKQFKFVTVFQGAGTLLCSTDENTIEKFNSIEFRFDHNDLEGRMMIHKLLESSPNSQFKQLKKYQGLIFSVGNQKIATIHSEPPMHTKRIFMSIVPGTKEEIIKRKNDVSERLAKLKL